MKRFLQCLFVFGVLLIVGGVVQIFRVPPPVEGEGGRRGDRGEGSPILPSVVVSSPIVSNPRPVGGTLTPALPLIRGREKTKAAPKPKPKPPAPLPKKPVPKNTLPLPGIPPPVKAAPQVRKEEFDPNRLKNLPKPVRAPADVELPKLVAENGQWIGSQSGITEPLQAVFRAPDTWTSFWNQAIAPYTPAWKTLPPVNFSKDMIVGVFMGNKPLAGYQIHIVSADIKEEKGERMLVIRYKNIDRFLGIFTPQFQVQPFHLLMVPSFAGRVIFSEDKEVK